MRRLILCFIFIILLFHLQTTRAEELLINGDFETGDTTGWTHWETFPWDGDGVPVEDPTNLNIMIPGTIGMPDPSTASGFFALTQQVDTEGTARGGIYQEISVLTNITYILTGCMAFYGDDIGDVTIIGIIDGPWNPSLALTTSNKYSICGDILTSWNEFSLAETPSTNVITIFTETRQDWKHGHVAGWYDDLQLQPVIESAKPLQSDKDRNDTSESKKNRK